MPVVNGYCSIAELRDQMVDGKALLNDALLERAINASSRAVDRYCGRRFWKDAQLVQRTFTTRDRCSVLVDDIATRTGLVIETGTDGVNFPITWAATDYLLEPRNADAVAAGDTGAPYAFTEVVAIGGRWFSTDARRPTLRVTAKWGWSAVPDEVKQAAIIKATAIFKRKDAPFGVAGFNDFGPVRITRADADVLDLLAPFELVGYA